MSPLRRRGANELIGDFELPGTSRSLELVVETNQDRPLPFQAAALSEFASAWFSQRGAVELALFAYYRDTALGATESGPPVAVPSAVWEHVSFHHLRVLAAQHRGLGIVQLTGGCTWEEEHGLEIDFLGGASLVYVGPYDGRGYLSSNENQPWNYASAQTQRVALESTIVEPLEADEQVHDSTKATVIQKPWWKLW